MAFLQCLSRSKASVTMWPEGFEEPIEHKSLFPALRDTEGLFLTKSLAQKAACLSERRLELVLEGLKTAKS